MTDIPAPPTSLAAAYTNARSDFLSAARDAGAVVERHPHPLAGREGEDLAIDVARLGPVDAADWVLIVSATHGVEGYCGSALQTRWLQTRPETGELGVVLIHGLNPHGFSWVRRVNEDNVDLNRNFIDWTQPPPENDAYDDLAELLVPPTFDDDTQATTLMALAGRANDVGEARFQEQVSGGQYTHPGGIFYGGVRPTWSNDRIVEIWQRHLGAAATITVIDLHTGLGPWGHGELITHEEIDSTGYSRAEALWGRVHSMRDGESVSASLQGDWLGHIRTWAGASEVTAAALEYGTIDLIPVLLALRADAWLHSHGDPASPQGDQIRAQVRAAFADDDPAWIAACWERFIEVLEPALRHR